MKLSTVLIVVAVYYVLSRMTPAAYLLRPIENDVLRALGLGQRSDGLRVAS